MVLGFSRRLAGVMLLSAACATEPCTLIGCDGGLYINLPGDVPEAVRLEIALSDGSRREVFCEAVLDCSWFFFRGVTATSVVVRITVGSNAPLIVTQELVYYPWRPNGPDCEPVCPSAQVNVKALV